MADLGGTALSTKVAQPMGQSATPQMQTNSMTNTLSGADTATATGSSAQGAQGQAWSGTDQNAAPQLGSSTQAMGSMGGAALNPQNNTINSVAPATAGGYTPPQSTPASSPNGFGSTPGAPLTGVATPTPGTTALPSAGTPPAPTSPATPGFQTDQQKSQAAMDMVKANPGMTMTDAVNKMQYDAQQAAGPSAASTQVNKFNTGYIDPASMPVTSVDSGKAYDQKVQDAYYNQQKMMLDPQWQQQQSDNETKLANMGLSRGSEAWQREKDNMDRAQAQAYNMAQNSAVMAGGAEATRQQQEQLAAGNFANTAAQQDFQNKLTSQSSQNTALTAQQQAAQGWENFQTQRANAATSANAQVAAAGETAGGMVGAANASAGASRYATDAGERNAQMANDLATRGMTDTEQMNNYNINRQNAFDPYLLQNLAAGGMSPGGEPTFAGGPNTTAGAAGMPGSSTAAVGAVQDANAGQASNIGSALGAAGSLGGRMYNNYANPPIGTYSGMA
jgi:hypothetical protein